MYTYQRLLTPIHWKHVYHCLKFCLIWEQLLIKCLWHLLMLLSKLDFVKVSLNVFAIRFAMIKALCMTGIPTVHVGIWAPSSEFVSLSIPSWQILTAHAQIFRGTRDLAFCLKISLYSLLVWASSQGSGETARMRRLAWTFAARTGGKYQIRSTRSIWAWTCRMLLTLPKVLSIFLPRKLCYSFQMSPKLEFLVL